MNIYIKAMEIGSEHLNFGITYPFMISTLEQQLKAKDLESKYKVLTTPDSKYNFGLWFVDNFSCINSESNYKRRHDNFRHNLNYFYTYMEGDFMTDSDIQKYEKDKNVLSNTITQSQHKRYHTTKYMKEFYEQRFFLEGTTNKQYIDYLELTESRESSQMALKKADESIKLAQESAMLAKKSTNFAGWALGISIVTALASIGLSLYQLTRPILTHPQPPYDVNIGKTLNVKVTEPVEIKQSDTITK